MRIGIFIPAYEAERTLEELIRRIPNEVYDETSEILIHDDESRDGTYGVCQRLAGEFAKLRVVRNSRNLGYGGTKKKAYRYFVRNGFDAVVLIPGDLQFPPERIADLLEPLRDGADVVLGSRFLQRCSDDNMPMYKKIGSWFLTSLTNLWLGLRITDYHTGFRAYTVSALRRLDIESFSDGHEISMEILLRIHKLRLRIQEVAVSTIYNEESRSTTPWVCAIYGMNVLRMLWRENLPVRRRVGVQGPVGVLGVEGDENED